MILDVSEMSRFKDEKKLILTGAAAFIGLALFSLLITL
jgi:hypothetical protein